MTGPPGVGDRPGRISARAALLLLGTVLTLAAALHVVAVATRSSAPGVGGNGAITAPGTDSTGGDTSAATLRGWGRPDRVEEFTGPLGRDWQVYDGAGHNGNGRRAPEAVAVGNGVLTITGDARGTTGGLTRVAATTPLRAVPTSSRSSGTTSAISHTADPARSARHAGSPWVQRGGA